MGGVVAVYQLGQKRDYYCAKPNCSKHDDPSGYCTVSMGKIFHNHMPDRISFDEPDLRPAKYMTPALIDREPESFYHDDGLNEELARIRQRRLAKNPNAYADGWAYGRSTESFDAPDHDFYDGAQTDLAIATLGRLKEKKQPFFLALGYYRPHLPFVAPTKYWRCTTAKSWRWRARELVQTDQLRHRRWRAAVGPRARSSFQRRLFSDRRTRRSLSVDMRCGRHRSSSEHGRN